MNDLGTLGGTSSSGHDINDLGQIVGASFTSTHEEHAVLWDRGAIIDLGTLGGDTSAAYGINNRRQVVGASRASVGDSFHAFLSDNGVMHALDTPSGTTYSYAVAINERGLILGVTGNTTRQMGVVWQNGLVRDLGSLGGSVSAHAINDRGQVVGSARCSGRCGSSFLWENRVMFALARAGSYSEAWGNDSRRQVVGIEPVAGGGPPHARLWQRDGTPTWLPMAIGCGL